MKIESTSRVSRNFFSMEIFMKESLCEKSGRPNESSGRSIHAWIEANLEFNREFAGRGEARRGDMINALASC